MRGGFVWSWNSLANSHVGWVGRKEAKLSYKVSSLPCRWLERLCRSVYYRAPTGLLLFVYCAGLYTPETSENQAVSPPSLRSW